MTVEEHFALGQQLRATGTLGGAALRPPGYPVFVAAVLLARDVIGLGNWLDDGCAVLAAQRSCLLLVSIVLFRLLTRNGSTRGAFLVGALLFANPLSIVLAGALNYATLSLLLTLLGALALVAASAGATPTAARALFAGLVWGLAALVRPVALALPCFVAAHAWFGGFGARRTGGRLVAWFSLGMLVVVAPWVLRNYATTRRFVPVSAQAGFALWASSVARPGPGDPYVSWVPHGRSRACPSTRG